MDSCLFIHGFTGGEHEISPLSRYMEQHQYRSRTFTLAGHGGGRRELRQSDRYRWLESAEHELNKLLEEQEAVHLIGFSTGALIASHLSVQYRPVVKSLTLLSAPVFPLNPLEIVRTLGSPAMLRNYLSKFGSTPPKATREFQRLVRESFDIYPQITAPTLIVQGTRDHLVKTKSAGFLEQTIPSGQKQVLMVEKSGHMVCHCSDQARVLQKVLHFIKQAETL